MSHLFVVLVIVEISHKALPANLCCESHQVFVLRTSELFLIHVLKKKEKKKEAKIALCTFIPASLLGRSCWSQAVAQDAAQTRPPRGTPRCQSGRRL